MFYFSYQRNQTNDANFFMNKAQKTGITNICISRDSQAIFTKRLIIFLNDRGFSEDSISCIPDDKAWGKLPFICLITQVSLTTLEVTFCIFNLHRLILALAVFTTINGFSSTFIRRCTTFSKCNQVVSAKICLYAMSIAIGVS